MNQPPLVPPDLIPEVVAFLRAHGKVALADQIDAHVADCRRTGDAPKVRVRGISGELCKFTGDRQPGDEPFEILQWDDDADVIPRLVMRRRANVEPCNYAPHARLPDGRIVGRDYFPEGAYA